MTSDCLRVDVVLYDGEDEANEDEEGGALVVEFEHQAVSGDAVLAEPLDHALQDGQLVPQVGSHHPWLGVETSLTHHHQPQRERERERAIQRRNCSVE